MSNMLMYRSNNDYKYVVGPDIWFRIKPNLGHF